MTAVHSPRWYRVADLKPRLSMPMQVRRQPVRGQTWYVLGPPGGGRSVRLNAAAYRLAARFDGQHSVQQLWQAQESPESPESAKGGDHDPPTQDEVIELLTRLREAGLLLFDPRAQAVGDIDRAAPAPAGTAARRHRNSVLAWRLRLADPTRVLDRLAPVHRALFSRPAALVWAVACAALLVLALQHGPTLVAHGRQWLATPRYAALALLLYVPIKLMHELAHGLAVRRWGGTVPAAGVTLVLGLPLPWVDASAASSFARTDQRVLVGAAGMMAELALAAVALPLWLVLGDGWVRDALFVTLFIAAVSTLLFNANPLQRLDGYYIATDALGLPNLAARSRQWWQEQLNRRLLRLPAAEGMVVARGERPWLAAYAPLSWLNGLVITAMAVAWLGTLSFALGLAAALLLGWTMALRPVGSTVDSLRRAARAQRSTARRWHRLAGCAAALAVGVLAVPLPQHTRVQGVVWPGDDAQLRAEEDGFVSAVSIEDGAAVAAGDVLLVLSNPALQTQLARQEARVAALEAELVHALPGGSAAPESSGRRRTEAAAGDGRAGDAQAELTRALAEVARLRERAASLHVRSHAAGRVALPQSADLPGRYLRRGTLVGQVVGGAPLSVRVALPEADAGELQRSQRLVSLRLASSAWQARPAQGLRDGAGAVMTVPSAALSQRHGGPVATDPQDPQDLKTLKPVVLLDVQVSGTEPAMASRLGERAWVRFDAGLSPLGWQVGMGIWRALQRHFNPQF